MAGPTPSGAAFFDVDETLITVKSMFDFLGYWLALHGDDGTEHRAAVERVRARAAAGVDRSEINRDYYRRFAGVPRRRLFDAGHAWYAEYRHREDAFIGASLAAVADHRAQGDTVVLVSGSFRGVLDPFAAEIGATRVLCSEPLADADGILTGEILRPMIGPVKAQAVVETQAELGLSPADCYAYGDHSSDLPMLRTVGRPRVVGEDPVLAGQAALHGWPMLSGAPGALASAVRS
ncbi:HAD family hydrolase [Kitasatospora camelliae]|uniref:HAD-IB family hydrolase n=1 Tax=Kitasatospora camelliae TaxID=3156397 RepID=A0AAU8JY38_9ACTN